jgi:signal transduction histidine kinase
MAKFKTRARALDMLGRQQIVGIPTAISELFKNAHDAYAKSVQVDYFRDQDIFVLRDNGVGMTEEEFLNRWLAIGTESKLGNKKTGTPLPPKPKGMETRPMLGEKGIGRLAIAAIGAQVLILTRASRKEKPEDPKAQHLHDTVVAFVNWRIFENPGINLEEIDIPVLPYKKGEIPDASDISAFVELFRDNLKRLKDSLDPGLLKEIENDLNQFDINPRIIDGYLKGIDRLKDIDDLSFSEGGSGTHFIISPTNRESLIPDIEGDKDDETKVPRIIRTLIGFNNTMSRIHTTRVSVGFRYHNTPEGYVELIDPGAFFTPEEFPTADHHFEGRFNEYGQFVGFVTIYKQKPIEHTVPWEEGMGISTECGPFEINIAYVQGKPSESLLTIDEYNLVSDKLGRFGGLYIYRDGVRVLPYGNSDYDFLGFEERRSKGAGHYFFSYRRMFGYIEITGKENGSLSEKAGREGFRENKAYKQFRSILKNFFKQIAGDFFRKGDLSEIYRDVKEELIHQDRVRRSREKRTNTLTKDFASDLNSFFSKAEENLPKKESEKFLERAQKDISVAAAAADGQTSSESLMETELEIRNRFEALIESYKIGKPTGVGLPTSLRQEWEAYLGEFSKIEEEVFEPTRRKVDDLINAALGRVERKLGVYKRVERILGDKIRRAKAAIDGEAAATLDVAGQIERQVSELVKGRVNDVTETIVRVSRRAEELVTQEASELPETYYEIEDELSNITEKNQTRLEILRQQLRDAVNEDIGPSDVIESLEEEYLALRDRTEADVELAQLGMAVTIINHEFENTVHSIRGNLLRLREWANANRSFQDLYRRIRSDFDHLDAYLELFTPLQRRLYRKPAKITGAGIEKYLRDLFGDRLRSDNVELQATPMFKRFGFNGYPSDFYPVFVNLVDNSLYWLKSRATPRYIKLDLEGGSTFIVSDNGPGVAPRDRERIFERGFTRKPGGRGMGLKISRDVLAKDGWELVLDNSTRGMGTVFKIKKGKVVNKEK